MWRIIKYSLYTVLAGVLVFSVYYFTRIAPLVGGSGAKILCSCVYLGGRQGDHVIREELGNFPISWGSFRVDYADSSAYGDVFGMFERKAVFKKGRGCTLLAESDEKEIRNSPVAEITSFPDSLKNKPWPQGEQVTVRCPAEVDSVKLNMIIDKAFSEPAHGKRKVRAIVVVYDGHIVAERYAEGYDANYKHAGWSMAKNVLNGLYGVLVQEGKVNVYDRAPVEAWAKDERSKITIDDLLKQSSGLAWDEGYTGPSDATRMLFASNNMGEFATHAQLVNPPGKSFHYSSGTSNILSTIMGKRLSPKEYVDFPYKAFLHKLGMYNTVMEQDAAGNFVASSYVFATARDWARLGLLYCNKGKWMNEQVLSEDWIKYTITPSPGAGIGQYGAHFWLNGGNPKNPKFKKGYFPTAPTDMIWAEGFEGQRIFIIPSRKLVIVKLALTRGNNINENVFTTDLAGCVTEKPTPDKLADSDAK